LQAEADIVVLDSPPLLPVTDAAVLTRLVDATLLVVTAGSTTRKHVSQALEVLGQVDAPLIGTVLNDVSAEGSYNDVYQPYPIDAAARRNHPQAMPAAGAGAEKRAAPAEARAPTVTVVPDSGAARVIEGAPPK